MIENITLKIAENVYVLLDFTKSDTVEYNGITFRHCVSSDGSESIGIEGTYPDGYPTIVELPIKQGRYLEEGSIPAYVRMQWDVEIVSVRTTHFHFCPSLNEWVENK